MTQSAQDWSKYLTTIQSKDEFKNLHWEGSFFDYLEIVKANPDVARNAFQRMYDMVLSWGTDNFIDYKKEITRYRFFDDPIENGKDAVFGLDVQLMKLVNFFKSAAYGYGTEKRVLLLHGPVGSAKSTIARLLKKGVEAYSRSDAGALYSFTWIDPTGKGEPLFGGGAEMVSPMHEDPLKLIPDEMRAQVLSELNKGVKRDYKVVIKGDMDPASRFVMKELLKRYDGDWAKVVSQHIRVNRVALSEKDRIGIGTFQPKDEKNQDSTELTGDINYRKIAEYGSDSDPRAFNFDGEFCIANRGVIEFIEVLKLDVAFLYDFAYRFSRAQG